MTAARLFAAALFAAVVLGSGLLHGRHTGRWQPLPPLDEYLARLNAVPPVIGDWQATDMHLDPEELARGGIQGHVYRSYHNRKTGEVVTVMVVSGRPGPISVHTPDVCYRGVGYEPITDPVRVEVAAGGSTRSLWMLRFRKPGGLPGRDLEIHWGWTTGGRVEAPGNSRITYSTAPALYKVYLIRDRRPGAAKATEAETEFLRALVPAVEAALAAPGERGA